MNTDKHELTEKDLQWFMIANANPPRGFYDFKDRFLRRYATRDGYDLQHIDKTCWTCDGSGSYYNNEPCRSCGGDGIHHTAEHWLERWNLCGMIFHKPVDHADIYHLHDYKYPVPKREIFGRIEKGISQRVIESDFEGTIRVVPSSAQASRAYRSLLLRHEPQNYYWHIIELIRSAGKNFRTRWHFRLIRLRNKMDLFPAINPTDDVPF